MQIEMSHSLKFGSGKWEKSTMCQNTEFSVPQLARVHSIVQTGHVALKQI